MEKAVRAAIAAYEIRDARPEWLNRTEAARMLGITDRTLLKWEKDYGWIAPRYDEHGRPKFWRDEVQALFERKKTGKGKTAVPGLRLFGQI